MIQAQAKYFAHWLTRSLPSDNIGQFTTSMQDAQVDLTPHQVDAPLFAPTFVDNFKNTNKKL